jgi:1,4-alpha-glucan branching enzyme
MKQKPGKMDGSSKSAATKPGLSQIVHGPSLLTEQDIYLFKEGNHFDLSSKLGSHRMSVDGLEGVLFAVWAPDAESVAVMGDFNDWKTDSHPLSVRWDGSGIWEGFVPGLASGARYKYFIVTKDSDYRADKGDPLAFSWEISPRTASRVWDLEYTWGDEQWMKARAQTQGLDSPFSIYEVHLGSWQRVPEEENRFLTYRELAPRLISYVKEMGFTHVEFLPVMEHPFYGSWGYQTLGYFAPTSRYGTPQDFMALVDTLHQNGIGVILDWVPSHFPTDAHGLAYFDGTHLFEHADPRQGFHPDWKSDIFNYGRNEVRSFLISSARFWLDKYHADGLRVDAVASMLYLDYSRKTGEWIPNVHGGRENLEAIGFLRRFNEVAYADFPGTQTIAEESTAWPMVSRPTHVGGLGFGLKWNMGWMHDTLDYFSQDALFRRYHQNQLTFSIWYAFYENFILPLSHDEVVHGKGSLLAKMPGDDWQKFANLRLLLGYLYSHPGKKLLFMGSEFGQWREWDHDASLDWHLLQFGAHQAIKRWVQDLNFLYRTEPTLYDQDFAQQGFQWVDFHDAEKSVISFLRWSRSGEDPILVVGNFTPVPRYHYKVGVPYDGFWKEVLNSDAKDYGGSQLGNWGGVEAIPASFYGKFDFTLSLTLPPLAILFFKCARKNG